VARRLFVLNGSNLNMLGLREPELYGTASLDDVRADCERVARETGFELFFAQTNAEHELVEWVHEAFRQQATVVINPAGFSFGSVPLLDALHMLSAPIVEVHITNIHARDAVHQHSLISGVAHVVIAGAGVYGYELAIRAADRLTGDTTGAATGDGVS
jgi:3-dehydroquinate dehydratase-2